MIPGRFDSPSGDDLVAGVTNLEEPVREDDGSFSVEDALGLTDEDEDGGCDGPNILLAMSLAEDDTNRDGRTAVRFVIDPYIGQGVRHRYKN